MSTATTDTAGPARTGLVLENVTLTYPDGTSRLTAVDDVSLTVPPGSTTALLGPSGSGKSSLLAVAATLTVPDSGRVAVGGIEVVADGAALPPARCAELRRTRIGIVFQQHRLLPSLTALEQLTLVAHLQGGRPRDAEPRARAVLAAVGLEEVADRRPHALSGGQRQRVNIARALVNEPDVLLVDEPTSALDHERGEQVVELVTSLTRATGAATLLVSHDESTLGSVDAVARISGGRLLAEPAPTRPAQARRGPGRCG
ncbi:putative ABC transport system ATP-binding protein [Georgenia soli]|uniref:Putative ABC transport system ATP-binding protein n=1 Tax=Georgenia soli TaxID=638953 RepID=A0A2A9EJP8_9MICO|nr:ABC transporter ATP-binding protein [Georgenia soli]PFG38470.1 putative ABC transport system ATP-binding protein [Georgenia soli]